MTFETSDDHASPAETFDQPPTLRPATSLPIHPLLAGRWSPRAIDPDRSVDPAVVTGLLEAARWAPSSANEQPWRFLVTDDRVPDAREQARACLNDGNAWAKAAPVLILSVAQTVWLHNTRNPGKEHAGARYDLGAAALSIVLQAAADGLVAHQMGGFDRDRATATFELPDDFAPVTMIAVGYPGNVAQLAEHNQQQEHQPRSRRKLSEIAFHGQWDQGLA